MSGGPGSFTQLRFFCISAKPPSDKAAIVEHGVRGLHSDCHSFIVPLCYQNLHAGNLRPHLQYSVDITVGQHLEPERVSSRIL